MLKWVFLAGSAAVLFLGTSCPPQQGGNSNPNNGLVPREWSQAYLDKENESFNAVSSSVPAVPATRKWGVSVGPLAFSSPVIGPDGVIYIGNTNGELVAINPEGSERWRLKVAFSIVSSPAVNPDTGDIFVLGQDAAPSQTAGIPSRLYRVRSVEVAPSATAQAITGISPIVQNFAGQVQATATQTVNSSAAPKLWGNFVFLGTQSGAFVFDQTSLGLVGSIGANGCFNLVCGSGPDLSQLPVIGLLDCLIEGTQACVGSVPLPSGPVMDPSVAIIDNPNLVNDPNLPTLVIAGSQCASGFRFHPAGDAPQGAIANDPHFEILWSHPLVPIDCDFKTIRATTPAVILGGLVVFSTTTQDASGLSTVIALDMVTGQEVWHHQLNTIQCPVTAALREIYVLTNSYLAVLDGGNGNVLTTVFPRGTGHNVALAQDFTTNIGQGNVFVTTDEGVNTFALPVAFNEFFSFDVIGSGGPFNDAISFPVLGEDGTLYVSERDGHVYAYAQGGIAFSPAIAFPSITWLSPVDNATVASAPGLSLQVNLLGAGSTAFVGTVTFRSDVDGTLCAGIPSGVTATCVTSKPLTIGTQHLTAFATDASGATISSSITVQVVNTPPTVKITSPASGDAFSPGTDIAFAATVTDPDQPSFPPASVQWTSSLDGNIGTGLSFTRRLSVGTHVITATATDSSGAKGTASVTIHVTTGPAVTILQPAGGSNLFSATPITFSAKVSDPTESPFPNSGVKWTSSIDGALGTGATITASISNGNHTITCTATDSHGLTGSASIQVSATPVLQ